MAPPRKPRISMPRSCRQPRGRGPSRAERLSVGQGGRRADGRVHADGQRFTGLNGGPLFKFNEAVSFQIPVETQAEVDRLSDALSAVPEAEQCGWVKDRYGLSWQIVPRQLTRLSATRIPPAPSAPSTP